MTTANLAAALAKIVSQDVLADLLNCMVGAGDDDRLTEAEAALVEEFHANLCYEAPVAVAVAQSR